MTPLTLLQMGDLHGHLLPRPNLRSDGSGRDEGGLARLYAKVRQIRADTANVLLVNTGDTIQGSAEALYTRGQALVDVVDRFDVAAFVPGNWDYLYGKQRFIELFGPGTGAGGNGHRWGAVAANVFDTSTGESLLPPCRVREVGGLRIGFVGLSSDRAINALGPWATEGIRFSADAGELPGHIAALQDQHVDLIVLLSEFGLAKNIHIANANPAIGVVFSSDMHEETATAVVTESGAIVSEAGQDGTRLAQLDLELVDGRIEHWEYRLHVIDETIVADPGIERLVTELRRPFVRGPDFVPHVNPINGAILDTPIDTVVGETCTGLHRSNFSHEPMPAAVEGSSANFIADAIRAQAGTDVGHFRGFRYGTHVRAGPVRLEDLYHFIPVGPQIATTTLTGEQLSDDIERSADGTFNPDPAKWTGGWLNAYAGLRFRLDVGQEKGRRISAVVVQRADGGHWEPLQPSAEYSFAGYWYARDPRKVGGVASHPEVEVVQAADGGTLDATSVVCAYLKLQSANPAPGRVTLVTVLPAPVFGNPEIQPLEGCDGKIQRTDDRPITGLGH